MRRTLAVLVGVLVAGAAITGCSGGDDKADTTSSAIQATAEAQPGVTWQYLLATYPDIVDRGSWCDPNSSSFEQCASLLSAKLGPLEADVKQLPASRARANVLSGIQKVKDGYSEWTGAGCRQSDPTAGFSKCTLIALDISSGQNIIGTNIKREADAH